MTCQNCKFTQKNPKRIDGLDRELVCPKLQDILSLWFAPQVPDYFECHLFEPRMGKEGIQGEARTEGKTYDS